MTNQQADPGTAVYDADGNWIGIVSIRNVLSPHLVVQKGRWLPKEICLPESEIARVDDAGVYLHLSREKLKERRYAQPIDMLGDEGACYRPHTAHADTLARSPGRGREQWG